MPHYECRRRDFDHGADGREAFQLDATAVEAALDMSAVLEGLRGELGEIGRNLEIGIGIHTGTVIAGNIGGSLRGDVAELANKLGTQVRAQQEPHQLQHRSLPFRLNSRR